MVILIMLLVSPPSQTLYGQGLSPSRCQHDPAIVREQPHAHHSLTPLESALPRGCVRNSFRIRTYRHSRICVKTNNFNPFRIRTSRMLQCAKKTKDFKSTRMNTSAILTHKPFRIRTSKKGGGEGVSSRYHPSVAQPFLFTLSLEGAVPSDQAAKAAHSRPRSTRQFRGTRHRSPVTSRRSFPATPAHLSHQMEIGSGTTRILSIWIWTTTPNSLPFR